jgi:hypothetical protein
MHPASSDSLYYLGIMKVRGAFDPLHWHVQSVEVNRFIDRMDEWKAEGLRFV